MFRLSYRVPFASLALTAILLCAAEAKAGGLVGYRNDSNQPIIVQSAVVVNNSLRRSKPQLLYPGEVAVDGLNATGVRRVTLVDPKKTNNVLHQEDVTITSDVLLSIQNDTTVMVKEKPAPSKFRLVATTLPKLPSRPAMPGPPTKPPTNPPGKKK